MKKTLILIAAAAASCLLPSCRKGGTIPSGETLPPVQSPDTRATKGGDGSNVITFNIIDAYPAYYAEASEPVPCDVLVYDRHDNIYSIAEGKTRSDRQWDIRADGEAPGVRECDVAVIVDAATGEKYAATVDGVQYLFRIGSYDD